MTAPIIISDESASLASKMWDSGYKAGEIARHIGVNPKWFEEYRVKNRDIFPVRTGFHSKQLVPVVRRERKERPGVMAWQTESGAVVSLPKVTGIHCPRVRDYRNLAAEG